MNPADMGLGTAYDAFKNFGRSAPSCASVLKVYRDAEPVKRKLLGSFWPELESELANLATKETP